MPKWCSFFSQILLGLMVVSLPNDLPCVTAQDGTRLDRAVVKNSKIKAKDFPGFQTDFEPALVPAGTYISLFRKPTLSNTTAQVAEGIAETALAAVIAAGLGIPRSHGRDANLQNVQQYFSGLQPLSIMQLPVGIFIPTSSLNELATRIIAFHFAVSREKIATGVQTLLNHLRKEVADSKTSPFNYAKAFKGIVPEEAIFIPSGYFVALTDLAVSQTDLYPAGSGTTMAPTTKAASSATQKFVAGIDALTVLTLYGGVYIPHNSSGGDIQGLSAPNIVPVENVSSTTKLASVKPTAGIVSTFTPDPDEEDSRTTSSTTTRLTTTTEGPVGVPPVPEVRPGEVTLSTEDYKSPSTTATATAASSSTIVSSTSTSASTAERTPSTLSTQAPSSSSAIAISSISTSPQTPATPTTMTTNVPALANLLVLLPPGTQIRSNPARVNITISRQSGRRR